MGFLPSKKIIEMEAFVTPEVIQQITDFIDISKKDSKAEVECKLLSNRIQTKDIADRILKAVQTLSIGGVTDETRLTLSYQDNVRVNVVTPPLVHKVCVQGSFKDVPLLVEIKKPYYEKGSGKKDILDISEANTRFSLRSEREIRRDWDGSPNDPKAHLRILNRKSFKTPSELFRIDFSMVKTRSINSKQSIKDALKQQPAYELEIEFVNKKTPIESEVVVKEYFKIITAVLQAYYQSPFLLSNSDIQRYVQEFKMTSNIFYDLKTLERRHLNPENPYNILSGYTVTIKADGDRCGLYVARDRKILKIPKNPEQLVWTGITARDNSHVGDFVDGEYIAEKNLFCIFDVLRFRNRDTKSLPLLTNDEDLVKNPLKSRLGCAKLFVEDLKTEFMTNASATPLRVETKLFLAGDGPAMQEAINTLLTTQVEYERDGLIFTPRSTGVAPMEDRRGKTWLRVYKWKPPHQNSIDFLVKLYPEDTIDPATGEKAARGELYVSRTPDSDFIYPREMMNGEYVPKKLPQDLQKVADTNTRIPSIFQPSVPRDPDAYQIFVPVDPKGVPIDENKNKVEDNTIIECYFDVEKHRWAVMRTRYDKTYQYRVLKQPMYGNDIATADNVWTSIHVPITEDMLSKFVSNPPDTTYEDDMYYRDDLNRSSREFADVYGFHNMVKEDLYKTNLKPEHTLLEIASGRAGDLYKWKRSRVSKVVAVDYSLSNIISPKQGAATRYLLEKERNPRDYMPALLFLQGDMTYYPLFEQDDKYMPILTGKETAPTEYLAQFEGLTKFDAISCQFALHYACQSEETFRQFAQNLEKYGKGLFFGTCSDGQSIYSLLLGKKTHLFNNNKQLVGEYTKQYMDKDTWTEEFGMPVKVMLESFEKPAVEYLVPFGRVTEILAEYGYELVDTKLFSEIYTQQTARTLTQEQQMFSFLNRTFVFRRMTRAEKKETQEEREQEPEKREDEKKNEAPEEELKKSDDSEKKTEEPEKKEDEAKPKRRKLRKDPEPEQEVVLFHGDDESQGQYKNFSNGSQHPIDMDGEKFPTVEHYFQAMKAKEFKDDEIYNKILKAKTPKAAKALGKKVKNFVIEVWESKRDELMEKAIRAKFVQHPEIRKELMATEEKIIGKADPRDTYWGIGTSMELEKAKFPSKWRGQNKLGRMLMALRNTFKSESMP
jgi:ribA/ribD-fused uncharacterized protein